jgi:hypothetical protein
VPSRWLVRIPPSQSELHLRGRMERPCPRRLIRAAVPCWLACCQHRVAPHSPHKVQGMHKWRASFSARPLPNQRVPPPPACWLHANGASGSVLASEAMSGAGGHPGHSVQPSPASLRPPAITRGQLRRSRAQPHLGGSPGRARRPPRAFLPSLPDKKRTPARGWRKSSLHEKTGQKR